MVVGSRGLMSYKKHLPQLPCRAVGGNSRTCSAYLLPCSCLNLSLRRGRSRRAGGGPFPVRQVGTIQTDDTISPPPPSFHPPSTGQGHGDHRIRGRPSNTLRAADRQHHRRRHPRRVRLLPRLQRDRQVCADLQRTTITCMHTRVALPIILFHSHTNHPPPPQPPPPPPLPPLLL